MPSGVKLLGTPLGTGVEMLWWNYQSASKRISELMFLPSFLQGGAFEEEEKATFFISMQHGIKYRLGELPIESVKVDNYIL